MFKRFWTIISLGAPETMVEPEESGVTEGGKNTASFLFHEWTQQSTNTKPQAIKKQRFSEEEQQLAEEKDAENIRKVLCKSFIQWFWELNLCSYKVPSRLFWFAPVILLLLLKWKSRNITKSGLSQKQN